MAITEDPQPQEPKRSWLEHLSRWRRPMAYVLFGLAGALALFMVWTSVLARDEVHRWEYLWLAAWFGLLTLLALGAGLWQVFYEPSEDLNEVDHTRLVVLTLGGLMGFVTVLLALGLAYQWWDEYFAPGLEKWREEWWRLAVTLTALFLGLVLMFASLQLARPEERSNAWMRRLLYGYNSVLGALLLLAILGVVNVLSYARWERGPLRVFTQPVDFTASTIYTLSPASTNLLRSLTKPVKVYVLLPYSEPLRAAVETLLDNVRSVTDKVQVEYVSPDRDPKQTQELRQKFNFAESEGVLVVYGSGSEQQNDFIQPDALGSEKTFTGEDALMKSISYLTQGKTHSVIYFTQGHGEYSLKETGVERPRSLGLLKQRLEKGNYEVKELKLGPTVTEVPADADVVIVAAPTHPGFPTEALARYMNPPAKAKKKGKLVVLLDVMLSPERTMVRTGLEDFLKQFDVQVGDNRILNAQSPRSPLLIQVVANPDLYERNAIARAFQNYAMQMYDVRTVGPQSSPNRMAGAYFASPLLITPEGGPFWAETDLGADPRALVLSLRRDLRQLLAKLRGGPLPVAVAVTAPRTTPAAGNPHAMLGDQEPRLVVYGTAGWLENANMREGIPSSFHTLFTSTLSWLRERPEIGQQANAKERQAFTLHTADRVIVIGRLEWLPMVVLGIGIISLGGGMWLVRRR